MPPLHARLGSLLLEVLVKPWAEHSTTARATILALILTGGLAKTALSKLSPPNPAAIDGGAKKVGPIRRVLNLVMPSSSESKTQSGAIEMALVVLLNFGRIAMQLTSAKCASQPTQCPLAPPTMHPEPASSSATWPIVWVKTHTKRGHHMWNTQPGDS